MERPLFKSGELPTCPDTPNCVCSLDTPDAQNESKHHIAAITYTGSGTAALATLKAIISELPRTQVVSDESHYLHAEFTSFIFRFVDDLQLLVDEQQSVIQVRSASRVGRSDFDVNRKRVEQLRSLYNQTIAKTP